MNSVFKSFFHKKNTDIAALTFIESTVYLSRLSCSGNSWSVKSIEQYTAETAGTEGIPADLLKNLALKSGCCGLPLYICLPENAFLIYRSNFPLMTDGELQKAVYWDMRGNSITGGSHQYSFYTQNSGEGRTAIIYAMPRAETDAWYGLCSRAALRPAGIFPMQDIEHMLHSGSKSTLSLFGKDAVFSLALDADAALPPYLSALAQTVLLTDSRLNLLDKKLMPAVLDWRKIVTVLLFIALIPAVSLLILLQLNTAGAQKEIARQTLQLHNMENTARQKELLETYQNDISTRKSILLKLNPQRMSYYAVLSNLGSVCLDSVRLDSVNTDEDGSILVSGSSLDYDSLQEYIGALKKFYFPSVILLSAGSGKEDSASISFTLKIYGGR